MHNIKRALLKLVGRCWAEMTADVALSMQTLLDEYMQACLEGHEMAKKLYKKKTEENFVAEIPAWVTDCLKEGASEKELLHCFVDTTFGGDTTWAQYWACTYLPGQVYLEGRSKVTAKLVSFNSALKQRWCIMSFVL